MAARSPSSSPAIPRSAEYTIRIAAPPDVVWKALTDPEELVCWFPLTAQVTPGAGGAMTLRWDDIGMDHLAIRIWNPAQHLQVTMPHPGESPPVVHDFTLEDHGASTILRLVAHGFSPDAQWDAFFDGVKRGWRYELHSLRHYLEYHRGFDRHVAWVRTPISVSPERAWATLFAKLERSGDRYTLEACAGAVVIYEHPKDFTGTVEGLNHALLRTQVDVEPDGLVQSIWLAAWGVPAATLTPLVRMICPTSPRIF